MDYQPSNEHIRAFEEFDLEDLHEHAGGSQEQSLLPSTAVESYPRLHGVWGNLLCLRLNTPFVRRKSAVSLLTRRGNQTYIKTALHFLSLLSALFSILLFFGVLVQSPYVKLPSAYPYRGRTENEGTANPNNEKIFIAANIIDESLIRGRWGNAVQELVYLLGRDNVFLSIYENNAGPGPVTALEELRSKITCQASIVATTLPLSMIPSISPPFIDHPVTKRITYLATLRNLALLPLRSISSESSGTKNTSLNNPGYKQANDSSKYSKILFLNDVVFSPEEAAHLLFDTNKGVYAAACALDFINPVKFYDTFALRNTQGDGIGLPLYPFFTPGPSQSALTSGSDAVPVKSCWGGMIAFNATFFTRGSEAEDPPTMFRSNGNEYTRESSECCLIHADINDGEHTFVNPYIRVAYGAKTFSCLGLTKRFERLWFLPHKFFSWVVGMPWNNVRRDEVAGEVITEVDSNGQETRRIAEKGGFCSIRGLFLVYDEGEKRKTLKYSLPND